MKSKLVRSFAMVCAADVLVGCVNRADRDNESWAGSVADGENVSVVDAGENGEETSKINPDKETVLTSDCENEYDSNFLFSKEKNLLGEYTVTYSGKEYVFDCYQVKYCDAPFTKDDWATAEDYFKLNIKVLKSIDGIPVEIDETKAPIYLYNCWGGDYGGAVGKPENEVEDPDAMVHIIEAMERGWVVVQPAMRGVECYRGSDGAHDGTYANSSDPDTFYSYAKLPAPLAGIKAAIRYLRYGSNETMIPGDKERIWVAGTSSGGDASVMIGASGNSPLFDDAMAEINALPGRDDVFGVMPSCPVMTRGWADVSYAWEILGDVSGDETANEYNKWLTGMFADYQKSLNLKATFATENIQIGDQLTANNYPEYIMAFIKKSAVDYLNCLGSREAIDEYVLSVRAAFPMYATTDQPREWMKPIFAEDNVTVTDIEGTYEEFFRYAAGSERIKSSTPHLFNYDKSWTAPDDCFEENGVVNRNVGGGIFADYAVASNYSFGKATDYAAVYSVAGLKWLSEMKGMEISQEYMDLYELQRNCTDPLYFIIGDGAAGGVKSGAGGYSHG